MAGALLTKPATKIKTEVTLSEACELIGVTRKKILRLVDDGTLISRMSGVSRVIALKEIERYNEVEFIRCGRILDELVGETERLGLYK